VGSRVARAKLFQCHPEDETLAKLPRHVALQMECENGTSFMFLYALIPCDSEFIMLATQDVPQTVMEQITELRCWP